MDFEHSAMSESTCVDRAIAKLKADEAALLRAGVPKHELLYIVRNAAEEDEDREFWSGSGIWCDRYGVVLPKSAVLYYSLPEAIEACEHERPYRDSPAATRGAHAVDGRDHQRIQSLLLVKTAEAEGGSKRQWALHRALAAMRDSMSRWLACYSSSS
jgi:hypothetical protein